VDIDVETPVANKKSKSKGKATSHYDNTSLPNIISLSYDNTEEPQGNLTALSVKL
jgi:hypothetical protein